MKAFAWLEDARRDAEYTVRALRRSPGFTAVAVFTLAVGIGVNTVVFTITNAVLFKGFPLVERNDRLLYLTSGRGCCVSYPDYEDWRAQAKSFQGMALVHGIPTSFSEGGGFPRTVAATEVTSNTFALVGQKPILGRDFSPADEVPGAPPVAIIRYGLWEREFAQDPAIVGRVIRLNGMSTTVIGVMPRGFSFPQNQDFWVPLVRTPEVLRRDMRNTWFVLGRLRDSITREAARAEMDTIGRRLGAAYPATNEGRNLIPYVENFEGFFIGPRAGTTYRLMWIAVALVLLVACANLANLLLSRAIARSREISVRLAIGAGRLRIVRQLLLESVGLALLGGVAGWLIARWGIDVYAVLGNGSGTSDQTLGAWFSDVLDYTMDYRVFAYLAAITLGTGVFFGLVPALRLSRLDVNAALKPGARSGASDRGSRRLTDLLVAGEVALAVVLLAGAGTMVRTFLNVFRAAPTFRVEDIAVARVELPRERYVGSEAQTDFFRALSLRLATVAGVESVTVSNLLPGADAPRIAFRPYEIGDASTADEQNRPTVVIQRIGPTYFETVGVQLIAGRAFRDGDGSSTLPVAIINQRLASRHWPSGDAVGSRLRLYRGTAPDEWLTIVGVVPNVVRSRDRQEPDAIVYLPHAQQPSPDMWVIARAATPIDGLATSFRRELHMMDSELPIMDGPALLADWFARGYQYPAVVAGLFVIFASIALLLAALGLNAVVAQSVAQRTPEIGVRSALGARARDILQLVLRQGLRTVVVGLAVGLAGWVPMSRVLRSSVADVSPVDPVMLMLVCGVLVLAAAIGFVLPVRRALSVDAATALRPE